MLSKIILIVVLLCLASATTTNLYERYPEIEFLNRDNFSKVKQGNWLVQFYAAYCGHCRNFVPKYLQVAKRLKGVLKVGAINAAIYKTFIPIKSVPQIKLFINGRVIHYYGVKTVEEIVKFVHKNLNTKK